MNRSEVRAAIEQAGILPVLRVSTAPDGWFAAKLLHRGGIPVVEVTMTVPGALDVVAALAGSPGDFLVGAGTVPDVETARCCVDAGARFLTSAGFDPEVVDLAIRNGLAVFPGVLTPTEALAAWKMRPDFLKVYPCGQVGGANYIRALKGPFPHFPVIAAGGVNQRTAADFILAGASAVSLSGELLPTDAIVARDEKRILELARRFQSIVKQARRGGAAEVSAAPRTAVASSETAAV